MINVECDDMFTLVKRMKAASIDIIPSYLKKKSYHCRKPWFTATQISFENKNYLILMKKGREYDHIDAITLENDRLVWIQEGVRHIIELPEATAPKIEDMYIYKYALLTYEFVFTSDILKSLNISIALTPHSISEIHVEEDVVEDVDIRIKMDKVCEMANRNAIEAFNNRCPRDISNMILKYYTCSVSLECATVVRQVLNDAPSKDLFDYQMDTLSYQMSLLL